MNNRRTDDASEDTLGAQHQEEETYPKELARLDGVWVNRLPLGNFGFTELNGVDPELARNRKLTLVGVLGSMRVVFHFEDEQAQRVFAAILVAYKELGLKAQVLERAIRGNAPTPVVNKLTKALEQARAENYYPLLARFARMLVMPRVLKCIQKSPVSYEAHIYRSGQVPSDAKVSGTLLVNQTQFHPNAGCIAPQTGDIQVGTPRGFGANSESPAFTRTVMYADGRLDVFGIGWVGQLISEEQDVTHFDDGGNWVGECTFSIEMIGLRLTCVAKTTNAAGDQVTGIDCPFAKSIEPAEKPVQQERKPRQIREEKPKVAYVSKDEDRESDLAVALKNAKHAKGDRKGEDKPERLEQESKGDVRTTGKLQKGEKKCGCGKTFRPKRRRHVLCDDCVAARQANEAAAQANPNTETADAPAPDAAAVIRHDDPVPAPAASSEPTADLPVQEAAS